MNSIFSHSLFSYMNNAQCIHEIFDTYGGCKVKVS